MFEKVLHGLHSFSDFELKPKKFLITECGLSCDSDLWLVASICYIKDRARIYASDSFLRRLSFVSRMHPVLIVLDSVLAEPFLHSVG